MTQEVQGMLVQIEATTAQLRRELESADKVVARTTQRIQRDLASADSAFDRSAQKAQQAGNLMRGAFAAIAGAGLIGGIIKQVDAVGQMSDRLRAATGSAAEYNLVQDRLLQTAKQTYRPLAEAQELYIRTADVIKSLGYNTQQTLDITDSFSYLLVTNAASADKAGNALNSYSKSLQTGKIDADSWQSILAAMPTVVDAVAQATGKSTDEIRRLGVQGKLSLDDLNKGFLDTVKANEEAAARMRASIGDALININTALGVYLGRAEDSTGAAGALADALGVVANNIDVVVAAGAGLAVAGITGRFYDMAKASGEATLAFAKEALAAKANAAAKLESATANAAATAAALEEARARAVNAEATHVEAVAHVELLKVRQNEIAFQAALAKGSADEARTSTALAAINLELAAAKKAVVAASGQQATTSKLVESAMAADAAATTVAAKAKQAYAASSSVAARAGAAMVAAGKGVLAFLGGPVGVAMLAGSAAAAFLLFRDSTNEASAALEDLKRPMQDVRAEFSALSRDQQEAALIKWKEAQVLAVNEAKAAYAELSESLRDALVAPSDARGPGYAERLQELQEYRAQLEAAIASGESLTPIIRALGESMGIDQDKIDSWIKQAGAIDESNDRVRSAAGLVSELTGALAANTAAVEGNAAAQNKLSKEAEDYIATLKKRTAALEDGNDPVKQATRHIQEHGKYTKEEADAILEEARANKAASEARTAAAEATQKALAATKAQTDAIDALIAKYDPAAKAQAEYEKGIALADKALRDGTYTTEQYQKVVQGLYTDLNKPIWDKHNKQAKEAADAIKKIDDQLESVRDRLDPVRAATKRLTAEKKLLKEGLDAGRVSLEEYQLRLRQLDDEYARNQKSTNQWTEWTESALERVDSAFADAWRNIGDGFSSFRDSLTNAFKQMLAELAHLAFTRPIVMQIGAALGIGGGAGQAVSMLGGTAGSGGLDAFGLLRNGYSIANSGFGQAVAQGWGNGGFSGAISSGWNYGSNALGSFFGSGSGAAGAMVNGTYQFGASTMPATVDLIGNTVSQGGNIVGTASGMTSVAPTWGSAATGLGSIMGGLSGAYMGYQNSGVKGAVAGGLGGWGGGTLGTMAGAAAASALSGTAMGAALGSVLPGIGTVIGAALGAAFGSKLFGGAWETKDAGLAFSVEGGQFDAQQFEYQKKKGGLFSSNKKRTRFSALDEETAAQFQAAFDATEDTVSDLLARIGVSVNDGAYDGLEIARRQISTKDKTEEEISQAIAEWFGSAAEAMNTELNRVFGTGLEYDLAGMQAFVGNLQGVNALFEQLNYELYESTVAGGRMAEQLSAVAGGFDVLAANVSTYYDAFYTGAEKTANVVESITQAFEDAEVALAGNRAEYRAMVDNIDRTTEAGREMFATLMALSGQAATYYSILEAQLLGAANSAYTALQRSIANQQREIQQQASIAASSISALTGISNSLDAALKRLRGTSDDTVRSLRAQAVMTLNSALVQARSGQSLAGFAGLQDALDTASQMDTVLYSSLTDFEREQGRTANLIAELEKVNGKQLSTEQRMLEKYEQQLSALDKQLAFAQSQLDALNGIDNSIMGVAAAIAAMNASVVAALQSLPKDAAQANTPQNNRSIIDTIYQSVLGRGTQGDEAGAAFWANALQNGTATYQDIATSIAKGALANAGESSAGKKSAEQYLKSLGIPGFASGGFHSGGAAIVGEKGPELMVTGPARIYSNSQTAAMMNGGGDTARAIAGLQQSVDRQGDALRSIAKHTMQTAKRVEFLERWDFDGLPTERDVA